MPGVWGTKPRDEIALTPDACPACQGSGYVPALDPEIERLVEQCESCEGTGKTAERKAA